MTENKVKFGLKNVHRAKLTFSEDGTPVFAIPKKLPGAVNLTLDPEGSTTPFYADDITYYVSVSNNGYTGSLELAIVPDDFLIEQVGMEEVEGLIVETSGKEAEPFALLFEFDGDVTATRHILYNTKASRPKMEGKTVEGDKTPNTDSFDITATSVAFNGKNYVKAKTTSKTDKEKYDAWYTTAPVLPGTSNAQG